ncbi:hypothetical protein BCV72DRAFT_314930 [Rhizopus microsporus var. microsporus]|uniref:Coth-domain-containing protein n=2 Tax=Rhizopus microsporus TaxID=58291 RepID=A0A2G4SIA9_RHIZD|nr:uncharacterized protein RHIMIDRAFT_73058 [Rhizopus microsporus ATCC 52813]ORE03628.1 hypothetical protein BCV72DRAFT_314930 [Rhizopus microsporus var. microsporus]PHZ08491.1 hypothetical protein RHIMIDRAFT_73058 [Rhizopus microsporus ATCC 52813]
MKLLSGGIISLLLFLTSIAADDVEYAVVAFPRDSQTVAVTVNNQNYPLQNSPEYPNIFKGKAPLGPDYRYALVSGNKTTPEFAVRTLANNSVSTGNEFFNRSRTVYDVPALPRAYNPIYTPFVSNMSRYNEVTTLILNVDKSGFDKILKTPKASHKFVQVYNMTYVASNEVFTFQGAGIKNAGQSSKDYAKQSLKIKFNKFNNGTKDYLYNRHALKLRAEANEPTMVREKLMLDSLAAAGAAAPGSNWVRLYVNEEPYGLFLMTDDTFDGFIDNYLHGGIHVNTTGATYKGNSMDETHGADLVYKGPSAADYDTDDLYMLEEKGNANVTKEDFMGPLIDFMRKLDQTAIGTDAQHPGNITDLIDNANQTMIQAALNFLSGSWDGFWYQASNFYLTQDLGSKKWTLTTFDFDETFGNGLEEPQLISVPYENYTRSGNKRPLVDVFIKSPYYNAQFQDILKTIIKRFFNPRVIKPRLDGWATMLKEDIAWDFSLPERSPGEKFKYTVETFNKNLYSTVDGTIGVLEWVSNRTAAVCQQLNFNDSDDLPPLPPYNVNLPPV